MISKKKTDVSLCELLCRSGFVFALLFKVFLNQTKSLHHGLRSRSGTLMTILIQAIMENSIVSLTFVHSSAVNDVPNLVFEINCYFSFKFQGVCFFLK